MRLPQFTAEFGLRKSSESYNGTAISASSSEGVVPASLIGCIKGCKGDAAEGYLDCGFYCGDDRLCGELCRINVANNLAKCEAQCAKR